MSDTKRCPVCDLPMFVYPIKHNGMNEVVFKCMSFHGKINGYGKVVPFTNGHKPARGVKEVFQRLYTNAERGK